MTAHSIEPFSPNDLRTRWDHLLKQSPHTYTRNAAREIGVSEATLLASKVGLGVVLLEGEWGDMLKGIEALGRVMALTRNNNAVHEKDGTYQNISVHGTTGLVLDKEIDLRVFFHSWHIGFAVEPPANRPKARRSLQFFNAQGVAVHKVFSTSDTDLDAWGEFVNRFTASRQTPIFIPEEKGAKSPETPDSEVDVAGFQEAWRGLKDTHDFFPLLRTHGVSRTQALRLAPPEMVSQVKPEDVYALFAQASQDAVSIMVFVPSPGVLQIHTGPVHKVRRDPSWFHVLDPGFSLHMRDEAIHSAWVVRKPTDDGVVTSMECFTEDGETVALMFGERKPGIPENGEWRSLVESFVE